VGLITGSSGDSSTAAKKLTAIESGAPGRGSKIHFSKDEVNAWMRDEAKARAPRSVTGLRVDLGESRATGYARIDFVTLRREITGEQPGWFARNLFSGERPVVVIARFESRNGQARVNVERVEVSGMAIEGRMLDFLIDDYLRPAFPDARVNEWFGLRYGIDRFTVSPPGLTVVMGSSAAK
jgi:hypothetical protein